MDTRQEEYILKIAETGSITKAAGQLYITQSALTQQLLKTEQELGIRLFERTKARMILTEAGHIYCDYARRLLNTREEALNRLHDMSGSLTGTLRIGLTRERGIDMFLDIFPRFYSMFPGIRVTPLELGVRQQHQMLMNGDLDLGFVPLAVRDQLPGIHYIPFQEEHLLIAVPRTCSAVQEASEPVSGQYPVIDLSLLKDENFVLITRSSSLRTIIDPLFQEAGFQPKVLFETASNRTLRAMASHGIASTILPASYAADEDQVAYFYPISRPVWRMYGCFRKNFCLTRGAKTFLAMAQEHFTKDSSCQTSPSPCIM